MLNYRIEGHGKPLLLVHGFGVSFTIWENLKPLLSSHYQLVMVELPGIGLSPLPHSTQPYYELCTDELEKLRLELGIEAWDALGYSSGTRVVEACIQRYPGRIQHAVFLCPLHTDLMRSLSLRLLVKLDHLCPALGNWILSGWRLYGLVVALGFNGRWHPYAAAWNDEISSQPVESLKATLRDVPKAGHVAFNLPAMPQLFIWGRRDIIVTPPHHRRPEDHFIPADHSAPMRAAPAVAEEVMNFLTRAG